MTAIAADAAEGERDAVFSFLVERGVPESAVSAAAAAAEEDFLESLIAVAADDGVVGVDGVDGVRTTAELTAGRALEGGTGNRLVGNNAFAAAARFAINACPRAVCFSFSSSELEVVAESLEDTTGQPYHHAHHHKCDQSAPERDRKLQSDGYCSSE